VRLGVAALERPGTPGRAIQRIVELRPDLVLLDIQMPGCTGLEVVAYLRIVQIRNRFDMSLFLAAPFPLNVGHLQPTHWRPENWHSRLHTGNARW